ncbi:transmembrane protein 245 isoform X2 [Ischnura elegans]|uniref:transmembrane protein 245 isoform X2 n=1 Tax=Ischnura elegans TaxID=197161 RepID=UPI001ED897E8|nr:transmembrane protein 245 isoform X2 [Ischnura elegans]
MRRRSTPFGMDNLRSPFDSMLNFIPQGHEKALKHALYNAIAMFLMAVCVSGIIALFYILEPFMKPLLWAVLCGSVLYPFKLSLANIIAMWLQEMNDRSRLLIFGLALAPIHVVDSLSEWALFAALFRWKLLLGLLSSFIFGMMLFTYTPTGILFAAQGIVFNSFALIESLVNFLSIPVISAIVTAHLIAVGVWWCKPGAPVDRAVDSPVDVPVVCPNENTGEVKSVLGRQSALKLSATLVWMLTGGYILGQGIFLRSEEYRYLRTPAFLIFFGMLALGYLSESWERSARQQEEAKPGETTAGDFLKWAVFLKRSSHDAKPVPSSPGEAKGSPKEGPSSAATTPRTVREEEEEEKVVNGKGLQNKGVKGSEGTPKKPQELPISSSVATGGGTKVEEVKPHGSPTTSESTSKEKTASGEEDEEEASFMRSYNLIYGVMWACVCVQIFKNPWIIQLLFLPLSLCLLHRTCQYFEVWSWICTQVQPITDPICNWYKTREEAIVPLPVKGLYKLTFLLNSKVTMSLLQGVDAAASMTVMFALIFFGLTAFIFFVVQSYGETFHMLHVFGNVINSTIVNNPELSAYLPEGMQSMVDTTLNSAYLYGREGLVSLINSVLGEEQTEARDRVESQVLELWDRVYQAWVIGGQIEPNATGPQVTDDAVMHSWDNLMETVWKTPGITNFSAWSQFAQDNLETVVSLTNSIWILLKGNVSLIFTIITTLLSIVFGGGSAVFGFFISTGFVVYEILLREIVFLTALFYLLNSSGKQYKPVELISTISPTNGPKIGNAFESAINGVFEASFKMAAFYGLWTWFIHNLFNMQIVYIPTVLAAVLAVVPFLGVYWASIPAVIDLWLAQGKGIQAILIFLAMLLPCSVVDTAIYKEMKSAGHPYLTGLSIAGGIFCLGVEGAIMGPLLLCCVLVVLNLSTNLIKDSTSDVSVPPQLRRLRRMDSAL